MCFYYSILVTLIDIEIFYDKKEKEAQSSLWVW